MKIEYCVVYKQPKHGNLGFVKFTTSVSNLFDFADLLQQQIKKGNIPFDATLVNISVSDIIDTVAVDWADAPPGTQAYAKDEDGKCHWYIGGGAQAFKSHGKWLCEAWVIREPAPDYESNCVWEESLVFKPIELEN